MEHEFWQGVEEAYDAAWLAEGAEEQNWKRPKQEEVEWVPTEEILFTQAAISGRYRTGESLEWTAYSIQEGFVHLHQLAMRVVKIGQRRFTLDNRRLAAFTMQAEAAEERGEDLAVCPIRTIPLPLEEFTQKFSAKRGGQSVRVRMDQGDAERRRRTTISKEKGKTSYPMGSLRDRSWKGEVGSKIDSDWKERRRRHRSQARGGRTGMGTHGPRGGGSSSSARWMRQEAAGGNEGEEDTESGQFSSSNS